MSTSAPNSPARRLTSTERKTLAIVGKRLPICDLGKDRFRRTAYELTRSRPDLIAMSADGRRWELTDAGRASMARAGKGSTWVKWAAAGGFAAKMIDTLNSEGVDAGARLLR